MATKGTVLSTLPKDLPLDFLRTITDQFSTDRIIGTGGFGTVYTVYSSLNVFCLYGICRKKFQCELEQGIMPDGQPIAVKKLAENAPIGRDKAFTNEVQNILVLQHPNIVKLVGYCHEGQKKVVQNNGKYIVADVFESLLCYEYLEKGSLQENLFGERPSNMTWHTRFNIIKGICNGLQFVHRIPIVHMDLKPENILLDQNMMPKIADFGLSRLFGQEQTRANTQNVVGSYGYIAPEYLYRGEISTQSDIYSLGILIIETTTGEKNQPNYNEPSARVFIERVRQTWTDGYIASVYSKYNANDLQEVRLCMQIGLECVQIDRKRRPSIENIVERLDGRCANRMANLHV